MYDISRECKFSFNWICFGLFSVAVWVAGLVASIGVSILGLFCFLSVIQLAMLSSKEKVLMKYSTVVMSKVALGLLAGI